MFNFGSILVLIALVQLFRASVVGAILGVHKIPEGYVGVYWRGGALLDRITWPGFHAKLPLLTNHEAVQVTVQTDKVTNIPCGTSGGTVIHFANVEVVNQLQASAVHSIIKNYTIDYDKTWIYDKIHHEINQFCSQHTLQEVYIDKFHTLDETLKETLQKDINVWAPGLRIISIRVTKPSLPSKIMTNYEMIEAEITHLKVAEQTQRLVTKQAETDRMRSVIIAEKEAMVEAIELNRTLAAKLNEQRIATIQNEMQMAKVTADADAEFYRAKKESEANELRFTPELLALETVRALANNTKIYFGESIPKLFLDNQFMGLTTP